MDPRTFIETSAALAAGTIFLSEVQAKPKRNPLSFEEVHGENPHLIVLDNLIDITDGGGEEWSSMRQTMKEIKFLARDTNAAVLILHHTSEAFDSNPCPPRAAIQGKVSQLPALICTIGQTTNGMMGVAPVKNRYGKANASGNEPVYLSFNPEFMYLADPRESL